MGQSYFQDPGKPGYIKDNLDGMWRRSNEPTFMEGIKERLMPSPPSSGSSSSGGSRRSRNAAAAGAEANRLVQAGESAVGAATTAASTNLTNAQQTTGMAQAQQTSDLASANRNVTSINQTAGQLGNMAGAVSDSASKVGATASIFEEYAAQMQQDSVFARANALPWLETGEDLRSMNADAGGMAGEWNKLYAQMSPDMLAANAATTTRKAEAVAEKDLTMSLSRRGVSPGSGAVADALRKLKERSASTVAAMMTQARKNGLSMQADALQKGFAMAIQASGLGDSMLQESVDTLGKATAAQSKATAALNAEGTLNTQAASIVNQQGGMYATGGSLALGIASTRAQGTATLLNTNTNATNTQVGAQQMAADYYSTQGGSLLSMLTQQNYNVLGTLFPSA